MLMLLNKFHNFVHSLVGRHGDIRQCAVYVVLICSKLPETFIRYSAVQAGDREVVAQYVAEAHVHTAGLLAYHCARAGLFEGP